MIKNHFKIAWRSLKKQPFITSLNVFGLAIGMAGAILITLYVYDELNFDTIFADSERIYRVNADVKFGGAVMNMAETPPPMASVLETDFEQVEKVTRIRNWGGLLISRKDSKSNGKEERSAYVDPNFFDFFGLKFIEGNAQKALDNNNALVLTESSAYKYFKGSEALGKTLRLNNEDIYTVAGVVEDMPKNSLLREHTVFMSMLGFEDSRSQDWGSHNYFTFIKMVPDYPIDNFKEPLQSLFRSYTLPSVQRYFPGITEEAFLASGNYVRYNTTPLQDIHLHSNRHVELSQNGRIENIYILASIGLFLLILASVNFMNLSTAHSLKRAKEVGIRKTLGSKKKGLVGQFLTEAGLVSFASLLVALLVAVIALPYFNEIAGKEIAMPFGNPVFWLLLLLGSVVLGLLSGWYPAFFMSRFKPVKVLKGSGEQHIGGGRVRSALVVTQFAISVFLIVGTLVIYRQLQFIQGKDLGYSKEQVLVLNDVFTLGGQKLAFKERIKSLSSVENATLSSYLPTPSNRSDNSYFEEGITDQEYAVQMQRWFVDYDYASTLDLTVVAGRDFNRDFPTDSLAMIINESALAKMGQSADEVLGKRFSSNIGDENAVFYTVVGVVRNFHFETLRDEIGAWNMIIGDFSNSMAIKLKPGEFSSSIAQIESVWEEMAPGQSFNYYFMDESFNDTYQTEQRLGHIFIVFTTLSIIIACLGLFGLAAFNAQKRTKEIGVRKVLGASVAQITYKLTLDFLKLVGLAVVFALPLGWYAMNRWLEDFSYRIDIPWWVLVVAAVSAIFISVVTVGFQSIKAAISDPVKSLRTE
ncbi:ABC transporter permease [Euzebyella marina]|uniref:ABC transporter permease n=1 Tax=Euzebyella marina TaxID=1761453 RepID=A0A3G2LAW4_9FLAO|nr:ABC transporter permease [Euzebyella marina]AYN69384.1 ABC transporter permease [Euzebyella marina]